MSLKVKLSKKIYELALFEEDVKEVKEVNAENVVNGANKYFAYLIEEAKKICGGAKITECIPEVTTIGNDLNSPYFQNAKNIKEKTEELQKVDASNPANISNGILSFLAVVKEVNNLVAAIAKDAKEKSGQNNGLNTLQNLNANQGAANQESSNAKQESGENTAQ